MAAKSASPSSQQRLRVFEAYRGRGKRTNDLWLVYSYKTDRDWILSSNRQLVHWLVFLESCPTVKSFDFVQNDALFLSESSVEVALTDGSIERHIIGTSDLNSLQGGRSTGSTHPKEQIKFFADAELSPHVQLAMRWMKAMAFAAAIRDNEHSHVRLALVSLLQSKQKGVIGGIIDDLDGFDPALTYGMLVRLAVEGHLLLDLSRLGFCLSTPWQLPADHRHVVA